MCGGVYDVITGNKFHQNRSRGFRTTGIRKMGSPIDLACRPYNSSALKCWLWSIFWQPSAPFPWYLNAKGPTRIGSPALHTLRLIARQPWRHCITSLRSAHWLASNLKLGAHCPVSGCWPSCCCWNQFKLIPLAWTLWTESSPPKFMAYNAVAKQFSTALSTIASNQ